MSTGAGIAQGPRIRMVYTDEDVRGTIRTNPDVKQLRCITRDIDLETKGLGSQEVYPDRQRRDWRQGFLSVASKIQYELSIAQKDGGGAITGVGMDDMLESLLGGTWSGVGDAASHSPGTLKVGTDLNTFTIERQFLDVGIYEAFAGCIPNDATIEFKPESIVGGTFDIIGMSGQPSSSGSIQGTGNLILPTSAPPLDVFHGQLKEDTSGDVLALVTTAALNIKNGRTLSPVIGSRYSPDVFDGVFMLSGTMSVMFKTSAIRDEFLNETESALVLAAVELGGDLSTGRQMVFTLPRIKYDKNTKSPKAEGPVLQDVSFQALYDSVSGTTLQIDRYL